MTTTAQIAAGSALGGLHDATDGIDHEILCTGRETATFNTVDGWVKQCQRCGFRVDHHPTRESAEAAYEPALTVAA